MRCRCEGECGCTGEHGQGITRVKTGRFSSKLLCGECADRVESGERFEDVKRSSDCGNDGFNPD